MCREDFKPFFMYQSEKMEIAHLLSKIFGNVGTTRDIYQLQHILQGGWENKWHMRDMSIQPSPICFALICYHKIWPFIVAWCRDARGDVDVGPLAAKLMDDFDRFNARC